MNLNLWTCEPTTYPRAWWRTKWLMNKIELYCHGIEHAHTKIGHVRWLLTKSPMMKWTTMIWSTIHGVSSYGMFDYGSTTHGVSIHNMSSSDAFIGDQVYVSVVEYLSSQAMVPNHPSNIIMFTMMVLKFLQDLSMI